MSERTELIRTLEDERNEQLRDGTHLAKNIERLESELEAALQRSDTLKTHAETLDGRINDQRQLMEELERELSSEQQKLVEQKRLLEAEQRARQDLESRALLDQTEDLQSRLTVAMESNEALEVKISDLQSRFAEERLALQADGQEQVENLRQDLLNAEQDNAVLVKEVEASQQAQREAEDRVRAVGGSQDEVTSLNHELDSLREEMSRMHEELTVTKTEALLSQDAAARSDAALESANKELERVRDTLSMKSANTGVDADVDAGELARLREDAQMARAELVAYKAESVDAVEVQALREQLKELEGKFRERTRELDDLRWRTEQEKADTQDGGDEKIALVLSQQLEDARAEIARLQSRLNGQNSAESVSETDDTDLTQLKGVGEKLAEQLAALGITSLRQIAAMTNADLDEEDHVLFGYRSRMLRDEWIDQARNLLGK